MLSTSPPFIPHPDPQRIAEEEAKLAKLKEKEIGGETLVADAHKRLTEEAERFMKFEFKAE